MAVRIRMRRFGRHGRPFYRIAAMDSRCPRDGRVIEELGYYDPMVKDTDACAVIDGERAAYWVSVGALPSEKVAILLKKYGKDGTHLAAQQAALETKRTFRPQAPAPYTPPVREPEPEPVAEAPAEGAAEAAPEGEAPAAE